MSSRRRRRWISIGVVVVLVAIAGIFAYRRTTPAPAAARSDPAVMVATALSALERSDASRLTDAQRAAVLPLLRVLRDIDPAEVEPSRALAQAIMNVLTPEQRAEVERLRDEARTRQQARRAGQQGAGRPDAGPGSGGFGPPPGGPGVAGGAGTNGPEGVAARAGGAIRQRLLNRLIARLETLQ